MLDKNCQPTEPICQWYVDDILVTGFIIYDDGWFMSNTVGFKLPEELDKAHVTYNVIAPTWIPKLGKWHRMVIIEDNPNIAELVCQYLKVGRIADLELHEFLRMTTS
jgi:hypothetical protein